MKVELITPTSSVFDGEATQLTVPAIDGEMGVLDGHADLMAALGDGAIRIAKSDGSNLELTLSGGGFLQVSNNAVSILAESATPID